MSEESSSCDKKSIIDYSDRHIQIDHFNDSMIQARKVIDNFDIPHQHNMFSKV